MPNFSALVPKEINHFEDIAEIEGVEVSTARWRHHVGRGPRGFKMPGARRVLFHRDDVIAWLEESYRTSQSDA